MSADNFVFQLDIYSENTDLVKTVVKVVNDIWEDGITNHINWDKVKKKFKVSRADVEQAWMNFL